MLVTGICMAQTFNADTTGGYRLVWSDEFNNSGLPSAANWNYEQGFVRNHELQWYQRQNARVEKGILTITAKKVDLPNPQFDSHSRDWRKNRRMIHYTSSSINTRNLHSWTYGRFVMRARIDTRAGLWPAFWTLGPSREWPEGGEIDIMEFYQGNILANIATGTGERYTPKWFSSKIPLSSFAPGWEKAFHIWRMDWTEEKIALYVDDMLLKEVSLEKLRLPDGYNPFTQAHYLLLNLAVGGDNGGEPGETKFPAKYEIDYVRVFQRRTK